VTVAALTAGGHTASMPAELNRAIDNGVQPAELSELVTHLAFYAGWPSAMSAAAVAKSVFAERGIGADRLAVSPDLSKVDEASEKERAAYVARNLDAVAPGLRDYTNRVLLDEVCRRPGLAPRDRSLVTISALITGGKAAQLMGHLNRGIGNGLTKAEVSAVITHLAFYAGWPNAMSAASVAKEVFEKRPE
jgi:4-carboxymuconolactone decarboxylase